MLFLLSPAKSLDYDTPAPQNLSYTTPQYVPQAHALINILRKKSAGELRELMGISDKLSTLNMQRYQDWSPKFTPQNAKQAVLTFNGDVYEGLNANTLSHADLQWAQEHVVILSGLYGLLRPLDLLQAYRLEMGIKLPIGDKPDLYAYWKETIATELTKRLKNDKNPVIVNLASNEYFSAVDTKSIGANVIECVFQDEKNGQYKIISFYAKRARGLMARFAIEEKITQAEHLKDFNVEGYCFSPEVSTDTKFVFRRREAK